MLTGKAVSPHDWLHMTGLDSSESVFSVPANNPDIYALSLNMHRDVMKQNKTRKEVAEMGGASGRACVGSTVRFSAKEA